MVMILWWVAALLLLAAIAVWGGITFWNRRAMRKSPPVLVANTSYMNRIPSFARAQRTAKVLRVLQVGLAVVGVVAASVLAGASRPSGSRRRRSRRATSCCAWTCPARCTSTTRRSCRPSPRWSTTSTGGSVWRCRSSTPPAAPSSPLTDDYDLVQRELEEASEAIDFDEYGYRLGSTDYSDEKVRQYVDFVEGTQGIAEEASIVPPDGLASCGMLFDQAEQDRSRSIIFATDNEVNGTPPIYSLDEAAESVAARDIALYTFYPGAFECEATCRDELETATEAHGGSMFESSDPNAIPLDHPADPEDAGHRHGSDPRASSAPIVRCPRS